MPTRRVKSVPAPCRQKNKTAKVDRACHLWVKARKKEEREEKKKQLSPARLFRAELNTLKRLLWLRKANLEKGGRTAQGKGMDAPIRKQQKKIKKLISSMTKAQKAKITEDEWEAIRSGVPVPKKQPHKCPKCPSLPSINICKECQKKCPTVSNMLGNKQLGGRTSQMENYLIVSNAMEKKVRGLLKELELQRKHIEKLEKSAKRSKYEDKKNR